MAQIRKINTDDISAVLSELKRVFKKRIELSILSRNTKHITAMRNGLREYLQDEDKLRAWVTDQLDERLLARNVELLPVTDEDIVSPFDLDTLDQADSIPTELICSRMIDDAITFVKSECRKTLGLTTTVKATESEISPEKEIITLRQVANSLKSERTAQQQWKGRTIKENEASFELFVEFFGCKSIAEISRDECIEFFETLKKIPSNRNKFNEYVGKSIIQLAKMKIPEKRLLSASTINKRMGHLSSLFLHAHRHGWVNRNPASQIRLESKVSDDDKRDPFTRDDLLILVNLAQAALKNPKKPSFQYWIPLVGLFTGMRQQEICQLKTKQVIEDVETGIWYIEVREIAKDQSTKNKNAKRDVPINSALIDLGFINYVRKVKHERLWHELIYKVESGYARQIQNFFNKTWMKKLKNSEKKSFHSLRHTFLTAMEGDIFNDNRVCKITGHGRKGGEARGRYTKYPIEKLKNEIEKLSYPPEVYEALGIEPR